jgi:Protein of unknown function (DUF4244)
MTPSTHSFCPRTPEGNAPVVPPNVLLGRRPDVLGSPAATHDERGITTAEYAVGTAAGAGLAGLLYQLLTSDFGERLLRALFEHVLRLLGIG